MKVQISLDDKLLERIDNYADSNYMSRSGMISFATNQYLNQAEVVGMVKDMALTMRKIADTSTIDHEVMEQLEDFERLCKMITGQQ
jgi:metal-responsive CopG/Arc/MetJ family transcriptional regulator